MNGLLSLLDDVVALTKLAAATIDDAAAKPYEQVSRPPASSLMT
jgi:hypothetical protein